MDEAGRVGRRRDGETKEDASKDEKTKDSVMESVKKGLKRFFKDLTTLRLLVYKMTYFTILASK